MDSQIATRLGPSRAETLAALRALKPRLEAQGIRRLRLFGSCARDEARPDSDVDLLVELSHPLDALAFFSIEKALEDRLGARTEMTTERGLHPAIAQSATAEALDAWA